VARDVIDRREAAYAAASAAGAPTREAVLSALRIVARDPPPRDVVVARSSAGDEQTMRAPCTQVAAETAKSAAAMEAEQPDAQTPSPPGSPAAPTPTKAQPRTNESSVRPEEPEETRMPFVSCKAPDGAEEAEEEGWLAKLLPVLSYPGWKEDVAKVESHNWNHGGDSTFDNIDTATGNIRRKQQAHSGDRSHPVTRALDALAPTLSYQGWQADVAKVTQCTHSSSYHSKTVCG
jgi:hypothetical protein